MIDCHLHTNFSPDSRASPEVIVARAIELGLKHIAITDHMDIDKTHDWRFDPAEYFKRLLPIKERYADKIYVSCGIEAGWTPKSQDYIAGIIKNHPFEFVICSVHTINDSDCYHQPHFRGRTRETVFNEYFETIIASLDAAYPYQAVGHLDYIMRKAPYPDKIFNYADFAPVLDKLLKLIITKDKILEYNTAYLWLTAPTINQVFARYYELGGRNACPASDAHAPENILRGYNQIAKTLRDIGFEHWTVVQNESFAKYKL